MAAQQDVVRMLKAVNERMRRSILIMAAVLAIQLVLMAALGLGLALRGQDDTLLASAKVLDSGTSDSQAGPLKTDTAPRRPTRKARDYALFGIDVMNPIDEVWQGKQQRQVPLIE